MTNSKKDLMHSPIKSPLKVKLAEEYAGSHATQKHSSPLFYISSKLFRNKKLKKFRTKWHNIAKSSVLTIPKPPRRSQLSAVKQQSSRKQHFTRPKGLSADVTINLLSDNEDELHCGKGNAASSTPELFPRIQNVAGGIQVQGQHFVVCQGSQGPNITLIPVETAAMQALKQQQQQEKRRRKLRPPKKHAPAQNRLPLDPQDSILLTDDSDEELVMSNAASRMVGQAIKPSINNNNNNNQQQALNMQPIISLEMPTFSQMVDEEVTVSLVPRNSSSCQPRNYSKQQANSPPAALNLSTARAANSSCTSVSSSSNSSLVASKPSPFPMLADETTVHTVIANRIYELSLSKLREGLATCVPEFGHSSPAQHTKCKLNPPPELCNPTAPPPISLKLSSDLSISLISDDDDEACSNEFSPEKLMLNQPQLSVVQHHVQLPASLGISLSSSANNLPNAHGINTRRKLC